MDNFKTDYIPFVVHNPCYNVSPVKINALVAVLLDDSGQDGVCLGYVEGQEGPQTVINGDLIVNGNIFDSKSSMQEMRDIYNRHTNANNGADAPEPQM